MELAIDTTGNQNSIPSQLLSVSPMKVQKNDVHNNNISSGNNRIKKTMGGGGGVFMTEVIIKEYQPNETANHLPLDKPIPVHKEVPTAPQQDYTKFTQQASIAKKITGSTFPPVQNLTQTSSILQKNNLNRVPFHNAIDHKLGRSIVVHNLKDSQFTNGNRNLPKQRADAYKNFKKVNNMKTIEQLAEELNKKDNFEHDFSQHSLEKGQSSTKKTTRSLPLLNKKIEHDLMSDAISVKSSSTLKLESNDDTLSTTSSRKSNRSRKSEFSIGSDADSDRIRQLESSLREEEESRKNVMKTLEEIQKKQEFLLSKLSSEEREHFENQFDEMSTSNILMASENNENTAPTQPFKAENINLETNVIEHLPLIEKTIPEIQNVGENNKVVEEEVATKSVRSYKSSKSGRSSKSNGSSTSNYKHEQKLRKLIKDMFHTIIKTDSIITTDQSQQFAQLIEKYPHLISEQDKELFYQKHNDPRFNGHSFRTLFITDHKGNIIFQ
ncbi:hypothetical protein ABK040_009789 [Willaertia magna]